MQVAKWSLIALIFTKFNCAHNFALPSYKQLVPPIPYNIKNKKVFWFDTQYQKQVARCNQFFAKTMSSGKKTILVSETFHVSYVCNANPYSNLKVKIEWLVPRKITCRCWLFQQSNCAVVECQWVIGDFLLLFKIALFLIFFWIAQSRNEIWLFSRQYFVQMHAVTTEDEN